MAFLILNKTQADIVRGRHGNYSELQPVLLPDSNYALPEECKDDPDLAEVKDQLSFVTEIQSIEQLPEIGSNGICQAGMLYYYSDPDIESGNYSGMVKCVQTHIRTIFKPQETPALFSFFRENSDTLEWIPNEYVELGWKRMYNGVQYEVIQKHQTLETWTPTATLSVLWKSLAPPTGAWAVGIAYKVNDLVTYQGSTYKCLQSHTSIISWNPVATLNVLWKKQ